MILKVNSYFEICKLQTLGSKSQISVILLRFFQLGSAHKIEINNFGTLNQKSNT